jgi:ankyrin repeat protein
VKQERRDRFDVLPNKEVVARSFIDACCSDESLDVVRDLVQVRGIIDADGFYVGSDGTETCALHASAFHGATQVLEFLCGGIGEKDASQDEGLCCVDLQDANGWTALHFAAGANCVDSARILADRGAKLTVVAENGYTPLQWAQRLSNHEVEEVLRSRLEQTDAYHSSNNRWIVGASQPLSMIAGRFFAMIPTH